MNADPLQNPVAVTPNGPSEINNRQIVCKTFRANLVAALMRVGIGGKKSAHRPRNRRIFLFRRESRQSINVMANFVTESGARYSCGPEANEDGWSIAVAQGACLRVRQTPLPRKLGINFVSKIKIESVQFGNN